MLLLAVVVVALGMLFLPTAPAPGAGGQLEPLAGRRDRERDTLRHTGGGLVRQSKRLAVPRDAYADAVRPAASAASAKRFMFPPAEIVSR